MADGIGGGYGYGLPALSHLFGEVESPTQTGAAMAPQFGGSPEQLQAILGHPQTQALLQQLGVHFDPSQVRQSPFFPNQFMQGHPGIGGFLNRGLASMAATPEAPMVSGWGSGLSRFAQGAAGGPEMLRQYQVRQMLAPFQAAAATIPGQEFQRKQQLLDLLTQMEQDRQRQGQQGLDIKRQEDEAKQQYELQRIQATRPYFDPIGGQTFQYQAPTQQQAPQQTGQLAGITSPMSPGMQMMAPGMPAQPGGWSATQTPTERIGKVAESKETQATKKLKGAQAEGALKRGEAAGKGKADSQSKWSKQYDDAEKEYANASQGIRLLLDQKKIDPQTAQYLEQQARTTLETKKSNVDKARGDPGASMRGLISPGAGAPPPPSPDSTQQGPPSVGVNPYRRPS